MPLSTDCVREHIEVWQQQLGATFYSHRRHWPSRLFRHEPLENIVRILRSGVLLSRHDAAAQQAIANDIAPAEIINATAAAHEFVRLYFRPKTPTQFHIEGIRDPCDYYQGRHAPILYMMVFNAERILTTPGVRFAGMNMQSNPPTYDDDAHFKALDFAQIYHEGAMTQDEIPTITKARCAEVLCASPLVLPPVLQSVVCRSAAERQLLLHEVGEDFGGKDRIRVFNEAGVFNADFVFVESVDLANDGVHVQFHPARRGAPAGSVEVRLFRPGEEGPYLRWATNALEFWKKWHFAANIPDGQYLVEIFIRGCLAYRSGGILQGTPF